MNPEQKAVEQEAAQVSDAQKSAMAKFFNGLSSRQRRALRRAHARVSGKKEGISAMFARHAVLNHFAPAAPPDPTPKIVGDPGEGRSGASI